MVQFLLQCAHFNGKKARGLNPCCKTKCYERSKEHGEVYGQNLADVQEAGVAVPVGDGARYVQPVEAHLQQWLHDVAVVQEGRRKYV